MAGLPTIQVLLDDGTGTFPHDVTAYVRLPEGIKMTRGRVDEASDVQPGTMDLTLNNTDGRFTFGSTILGTPSRIKVSRRLRLKLTANGTTVNRHTGYVQGWPTEWPGGKTLTFAPIRTSDALARAERKTMKSLVEEAILRMGPTAYWTLGDPAGSALAAERSGGPSGPLGVSGGVTFGVEGGSPNDGLTVASVPGDNVASLATGWLPPLTGAYSVLIAFAQRPFTDPLTGWSSQLFTAARAGAGAVLASVSQPGGSSTGFIAATFYVGSSNGVVQTPNNPAYANGSLRVVLATFDGTTGRLYVDGALIGSAVPPTGGAIPHADGVSIGPDRYRYAPADPPEEVGHFAIFPRELTALEANDVAALILAASEPDSNRVSRLAQVVGIPTGTVDAGLTNVPMLSPGGGSAADAIREVADAEVGLAYIDGSGALTFRNRQASPVKTTPDLTVPAVWCSPDTAFQVDTQGLVNSGTGTRDGGTPQVVRDAASVTEHGEFPDSRTYLVLTDAEVRDRIAWRVANHAQPAPRVGTLKVDALTRTAAEQASLLDVEPGHWLRVTGLPSQTPGGTTADLVVEGIAEDVSDTAWDITFNVVSRSLYTAWILDNATYSVLDSTTRLYV
jgi:hypothetical protein